ncbi:MAG: hypothetical protein ACR2H9_10595 [Longimicrobiaceae bacterium]
MARPRLKPAAENSAPDSSEPMSSPNASWRTTRPMMLARMRRG